MQVHGVTQKQAFILDKIWSFEEESEFREWERGLPYAEWCEVHTLMQLIALSQIDEDVERDIHLLEAKEKLQSIGLKLK